MKLTTAGELQNKFKAGLQICGENSEGELEWIGTNNQWEQENLNAYYDENKQLNEQTNEV